MLFVCLKRHLPKKTTMQKNETKKTEKQYTFSDIIDAILMVGGFGLSLVICMGVVIADDFFLPKSMFLLQTIALVTMGIGVTRRLVRQKQNKIDELEEFLPPAHFTHSLQSPNQTQNTTPYTNSFSRNTHFDDSLEARFLEALIYKQGRITLVETVILMRESIDKILPIIEKLQSKGIIGTELAENGQIIYVSV